MQTFEVTGDFVTLYEGLLDLSDEQIEARKHALEEFEDSGLHRVIKPVGFKKGEIFGYEGPHLGPGVLSKLNGGASSEPVSADAPIPPGARGAERETGDEDARYIPVPAQMEGEEPVIAECTVGEFMETSGMSFADVKQLLADYGHDVHAKKDVIPAEITAKMAEDFAMQEEPDTTESEE